jgi:hypothetical protein
MGATLSIIGRKSNQAAAIPAFLHSLQKMLVYSTYLFIFTSMARFSNFMVKMCFKEIL